MNVCVHRGFRLELRLVLRTLLIDDRGTEVVLLLLVVLGQRMCEAYTLDKGWRNDPAPCGVSRIVTDTEGGKTAAEGANYACQSLPYICLV